METDDSGTTAWGTITGEWASVLVCVEGREWQHWHGMKCHNKQLTSSWHTVLLFN